MLKEWTVETQTFITCVSATFGEVGDEQSDVHITSATSNYSPYVPDPPKVERVLRQILDGEGEDDITYDDATWTDIVRGGRRPW